MTRTLPLAAAVHIRDHECRGAFVGINPDERDPLSVG